MIKLITAVQIIINNLSGCAWVPITRHCSNRESRGIFSTWFIFWRYYLIWIENIIWYELKISFDMNLYSLLDYLLPTSPSIHSRSSLTTNLIVLEYNRFFFKYFRCILILRHAIEQGYGHICLLFFERLCLWLIMIIIDMIESGHIFYCHLSFRQSKGHWAALRHLWLTLESKHRKVESAL